MSVVVNVSSLYLPGNEKQAGLKVNRWLLASMRSHRDEVSEMG